jgi:hypothetical protein
MTSTSMVLFIKEAAEYCASDSIPTLPLWPEDAELGQ